MARPRTMFIVDEVQQWLDASREQREALAEACFGPVPEQARKSNLRQLLESLSKEPNGLSETLKAWAPTTAASPPPSVQQLVLRQMVEDGLVDEQGRWLKR